MRKLEAAFRSVFPPRYQYDPLGQTEIRLLRLSSGRVPAGELVHVDLRNPPPYVALSYTWGTLHFRRRILLDGRPLSVTRNLHSFLRHHGQRLINLNELLWVDAICINQQNPGERTSQVPLMKSIYESARRVEIWLGPSATDGDLAMKTLIGWGAHLLPLVGSFGGQLDAAAVKAIVDSPNNLIAPLQLERGARYWTAIEQLCDRAWWARGWTLQESTVSAPRYLYCGDFSIELNLLCFVLHIASAVHNSFNVQAPWNIQQISTWRHEGSHATLLEVLAELRFFMCTDPRDKVYAGLGLVADDISQDIVPDYTRPAEEVYKDVVKTVLNRYPDDHKLDFLAYAVRPWHEPRRYAGTSPPKRLRVPSWLPDWNENFVDAEFPKSSDAHGLAAGSRIYNATGTYPTQASLVGNQLHVVGLLVDFVFEVSSKCCQTLSSIETALLFAKTWEPKDPARQYKAGGTIQQAFLSTIVADAKRMREELPRRGFALETKFWSIPDDQGKTQTKEESIAFSFVTTSVAYTIWQRRLFWTTQGYMGIGPGAMNDGDRICALFGGQVLYVLRDVGSGQHEFIGECYVHGLMDKEVLCSFEAGQVKSEIYVIV